MMLVQAVVGSVILMNRRQSTELFGPSVLNFWREWLLRGLILLSLTCQIVLAMLGNRRKYIDKIWVRSIVWLAYILADSVAAMAIGVLSNDTRQIYRSGDSNSLASAYGLTAFWAPFLLLHMGGMDTITAYSLEDNELWLRHCFTIVTQSVTTMYILFMSWSTLSRLSPLFMVVFYVGLIKYCERVWALLSASEKRFRGSIPQILTGESKIEEECKLKRSEGYLVTTHQAPKVEVPVFDHWVPNSEDANEILAAYSFLEMVKRLFADLILGFQDRDASRAFFQRGELGADMAFKIIEIELGLIYDIMYTKAMVVYSAWGIASRIIGSFLILGVLVMVSLDKALVGKNSSMIDITLVLLVAALLLDLFAFGELFLSDQTAHWLITHNRTTALGAINRIRTMLPTNCRKRKRWSKTVGQLSLLSFCFARKKKPLFGLGILKLLGIVEIAEIYMYKTPPAPLYMDEQIFHHIKRAWPSTEQYGPGTNLKAMYGLRGCRELRNQSRTDLEWSVKMEFELSVLVWHLATEICYRVDHRSEGVDPTNFIALHKKGKCISQYMLYLLVEHPNMLPIGIGQIKFRDLYSDLGDFIEMHLRKPLNDVTEEAASDMLMEMEMVKDENMLVGEGDRSNFVIFHGCKLASQLQKEQEEKKWNMIFDVWIEILGHAASQCKGRHHAQQLRRGGEYLTHLWLLMAHFGLTDHFQIQDSRAIGEAVLW